MANDLSGPVWYVDTAATLVTRRVVLKGVQWVSESASAGDNVEIRDGSQRRVWASVAAGSNHKEADHMEVPCQGLIVLTLNSGFLLLDID